MKIRTMKILLVVQLVVIVLIVKGIIPDVVRGIIPNGDVKNKTGLLREISPDGNYVLTIEERGKPVFFFYPDCIRVYLRENTTSVRRYAVMFHVDIVTGGSTARYEIEWMEDGVQIILSGKESHYYILPFKTLEDAGKLL